MSGLVISLFLYPTGGHQGPRDSPISKIPSRLSRIPAVASILGQDSCFALPCHPSLYFLFLSLYCTPLVNHTLYFPSQI